MMMMEYGSQYAPSTFSSDTLSGSMVSRTPRVRTVRMIRPNTGTLPPPGLTCRHGPSLGFSLRGGREHGTGFFVSQVEVGSEAHRQGLKVGDQIVRVNGFTVEDAVHKEVLQLISNHTHLTMKVRSVGMLPVKDKKTDTLSWQIISDNNSSTRSSPQLTEKIHDVRISIIVAPRTKLGCGICKGPEWKPGIFVQFTKEGGIAREAGLRPGDQVLFCNNVDFSDISFNEAVNIMKSARQLDLLVRKSAGSELFPGESSGYNSSASSVTGDQSPSWSDSKRLSIVKEEINLDDRLAQLERFKNKKWDKIEWDDEVKEENNYQFKPTIINVTDCGSTINNNGEDANNENATLGRNKSNKIADICLVSRQHEMKTVVVEVHRSDEKEKPILAKSPSTCSFNSVASKTSNASSSLSSAICEEIQRRAHRTNAQPPETPSIDDQLQIKKIMKNVNSDKQQQHSQLMDEFRKAHSKMFKSSPEQVAQIINEIDLNRNKNQNGIIERLSMSTQNQSEVPEVKSTTPQQRKTSSVSSIAPPPPPLPVEDINGDLIPPSPPKQKVKPPPPPVPQKTSSSQPPPCPTPDYDSLSLTSNSTLPRKATTNGFLRRVSNPSQQNDAVEMESLESFKLNGTNEGTPKPPSTYFNKTKLISQLSNGSMNGSTLTKQQRPVSVTIGGYPSGVNRKQPKKLEFLNGHDTVDKAKGQSINSQFASELAQTLSRSNLKKRTESMENLLNHPQIKADKNGSVRISVNSSLGKHLAKSTNDLSNIESYNKPFSNRVTISIPSNEKRGDAPSGILKNGHGNILSSHRPVVQQKSITFGDMPTVINDQLHVT